MSSNSNRKIEIPKVEIPWVWISGIVGAWIFNYVFQYIMLYRDIFEFSRGKEIPLSNIFSSSSLAFTLIIILISSLRYYAKLFDSRIQVVNREFDFLIEENKKNYELNTQRFEKFISNQLNIQKTLIENKYKNGIFERIEGVNAIEMLTKKIIEAKVIYNTHFIHHPKVTSEKEWTQYKIQYNIWRNALKTAIISNGLNLQEVCSSNEHTTNDTKNWNESYKKREKEEDKKGYTGSYIGKILELKKTKGKLKSHIEEHKSWINFTIFEYGNNDDKRPCLWVGYGIDSRGEFLQTFYTENEYMIADFKKRFIDLIDATNLPT